MNKKALLLLFLTNFFLPALFGQNVTLMGKIQVDPPLDVRYTLRSYSVPSVLGGSYQGLYGLTQAGMEESFPGYVLSYTVSPRQMMERLKMTIPRYVLLFSTKMEIAADATERDLPIQKPEIGVIYSLIAPQARELYVFGLGAQSITRGIDLFWPLRFKVVVPLNSTHVYLGTFLIRRNERNEAVGFEIQDEYDQAVAELRAKDPSARLVRGDLISLD